MADRIALALAMAACVAFSVVGLTGVAVARERLAIGLSVFALAALMLMAQ